ncbi:MAG: hypothetical protein J07HN4v3_00377 [Halonotius sp. J07HN4]|nr:MAG: hypothetical protein J07HN4v3_00377 [Halonotius sp. J07HN4]
MTFIRKHVTDTEAESVMLDFCLRRIAVGFQNKNQELVFQLDRFPRGSETYLLGQD